VRARSKEIKYQDQAKKKNFACLISKKRDTFVYFRKGVIVYTYFLQTKRYVLHIAFISIKAPFSHAHQTEGKRAVGAKERERNMLAVRSVQAREQNAAGHL
jgi:hypothetical protein